MRIVSEAWRRLGSPWTAGELAAEIALLADIANDHERRGVYSSGSRVGKQELGRATLERRRRSLHLIALVIMVVVATSFAAAFTDNRVITGIQLAAIASAAPTALLLGLRR